MLCLTIETDKPQIRYIIRKSTLLTHTNKKFIPESELIINPDGSVFHLHLLPEQLTDRVILVGDPGRVNMVAEFFDTRTFEVSSREFHTIGGTYKGKPIMVSDPTTSIS